MLTTYAILANILDHICFANMLQCAKLLCIIEHKDYENVEMKLKWWNWNDEIVEMNHEDKDREAANRTIGLAYLQTHVKKAYYPYTT